MLGEQATSQAVSQAAGGARSLHLSCHGFFDLQEPMLSGLVLSDGVLTAATVLTWQLPGSLVTLSACSTGRQRITPGDELYGLARAFFFAGASSLVVSMWPVDARTTLELMRMFYRQVRQGEEIAAALRSAMNAIRLSRPHPFYWASFCLVGEGRALALDL
jgi:CHAT domain-containing protein